DQAKQNQQISDFLTKGAKLIIVGNINEGVNTVIDDAASSNVQIIAYDRLILGSDKYDYYITFDNFKVGQLQGQAIEMALDLQNATEPKNIALFAGSPTDNNATLFFDGAMNVLNPYIQNGMVNIVGPAPTSSRDPAYTKITTENWKAELAKTRMENLLNSDAEELMLDAVLAPNDPLARAIIEACSADQKYEVNLPIITGQDGETPSIQSIKDGKQYMTVFKDTRKLAEATVLLADAILKGEEPNIPGTRLDTTSYNTGLKTVKSYLLEPISVLQDNYQAIMIDSGYIPASEIK
ncbi:MAG: sugar ABC transporter substrate-binding protein, partial [Treponemataceae bacterium]